ncbi:MAG: hypothetical protein ACRD6X_17455, partial [Pyrinomonadaceae bacterium]
SNQILITFEVPKDFEGQPVITLVAPGKALDLSAVTMTINGQRGSMDAAEYMFGKRPTVSDARAVSVARTDVYKAAGADLIAVITGENMHTVTEVLANGSSVYTRPAAAAPTPAPNRIRIPNINTRADAEHIQFTLLTDNAVIQPPAVSNPLFVRPPSPTAGIEDKSALLRIETVKLIDRVDDAIGNTIVVAELSGSGFTDKLALVQADGVTPITGGRLIVVSPTRAFVKLTMPISDLPFVVTLFSEAGKLKASAIITGKLEMGAEDPDDGEDSTRPGRVKPPSAGP